MVASSIQFAVVLRWYKGGVVIVNVLSFIIGVLTGIVSGLGIGGGSLLVLYLTAIAGVSQYQAGGINLLYFIGCAPAALVGHVKNKQVHIQTAIVCILGGLISVIPVSLLARQIDTDLLRRLFGILILYVALYEWRQSNRADTMK